MKIAGKKGFYRIKNPDRKKIKDGKEVTVKAGWHRIYGEVASDGDDIYVPVVEERDGVTMMRLKDLTLKVKICAMVDLPGQKISFFRKGPEKDITKIPGRIGFDIRQVYIPIITKTGKRVKLRFDRFMFEEKFQG